MDVIRHSPDPVERRRAVAELEKRGMVASAWESSKSMVFWMFLVFLLSGLAVLVIVCGVRQLRALPAPAMAEATRCLKSRASAGAVLGGLAILLGLV